MENENLNQVEEQSTQVNAVSYNAGEEAKDANGETVDSSKFGFVQEYTIIHDTKFTTKPTTFMKDAMRRFMKNKSSVVGGVILGVLFLLAIILPFAMVSVDTTSFNSLETHLPMKLLPAGTGFWDGTVTSTNTAYPYEYTIGENDQIIDEKDENGKKIFNATTAEKYPEESDIVKVENVYSKYFDHASSGFSGGYAAIVNNAHDDATNGYMYFSPMQFSSSSTYTIKYTLGTLESADYVVPEYKIIAVSNSNITSLTDWTSDYGEAEAKPSTEAQITPHATQEQNLSNLIKAKNLSLNSQLSFGFMFKSDASKKTGFYLKNFSITSTNIKETSNLQARSFGTGDEDSKLDDANAMVMQEKNINGNNVNPSYWTTVCDQRFSAIDTFSVLCDITYDMYQVTYGLQNNFPVAQSVMDRWIKENKVTFDYESAFANKATKDVNSGFVVNDDSVYVNKIQDITMDDSSGTPIYSFTCQATIYKYLGYDAIPLHLFGTDYQGKDLLKYVFSGLRTSLLLGLIVSAINIVLGIIWGSISGYFGGMVDITMERLTDILGGVPWIVLMTVLTIKLGQTFFVFALALCLTGWIGTASTTRSQFYRYRDREYVLAAKTLGARPGRLIFKHILPNAIGTIVTRSILMIPSTIFSEATISYLGLGLSNLDSLGVILSKNQKFLSTYPSELVFPAVIISLLMICFNLFGNGLRDAFNPSLKGED